MKHPTPAPYTRPELLALIAILLLAAVLRLGAPGITEFKLDEANLSRLALDMARGRDLPLLGIGSSVGLPNAPINVYVLAIPYLFSSDPIVATLFIGLLSVVAVGLLYGLARRYYGQKVALLAALLYAASPWAVIFSRKIWAQNMLHSLIIVIVATGLLGFIEQKRWAQWLHLPLLALAFQIHYGAFVLFPVSLYLMWAGRRHWTTAFRNSLLLLILISLPYGLGMLQEDLFSLEKWQNALSQNDDERSTGGLLTTDGLRLANIAITGTDIHALAGAAAYRDYLNRVPDAYPLFMILAGLAWGAVPVMLWHRRGQPPHTALLIWFLTPIAVFTFNWVPVTVHYFIPLLPAAFILMAWLLVWLWEHWPRAIILSGGVIGAIVVLQVWLQLALLDFLNTQHTPGGFGVPYHYLAEARQAVLDRNPNQVIVNMGSQFTQYDNDASVWDILLDDVPAVRFVNAVTQVYPANPNGLLLTKDCEGEQVFPLRSEQEGCYALQALPVLHASTYQPITTDQHFANGVYLRGYQWREACFDLLWEITQTADQDYTFAMHFMDASGERVAIADALAWQGHYWRPGDRVVRTFCVDPVTLPAITGLHIGMYLYDGTTYHNVDVVDQQGTWIGQFIQLEF